MTTFARIEKARRANNKVIALEAIPRAMAKYQRMFHKPSERTLEVIMQRADNGDFHSFDSVFTAVVLSEEFNTEAS